ncbi:MAG: hypothetical protein FJX67_06675 [Alphaproteobacteria bacterium]|nr:hypothetical protein [Alphaproteobacteria bacterium]
MIATTIGFDIRLAPAAYLARDWDDARRRRFLLEPAIAWPRSVDRTAWPSLFRFPGDAVLPTRTHPAIDVAPVSFGERVSNLWAAIAPMRARAGGAADVLVRLDLLSATSPAADPFWGYTAEVAPIDPGAGPWTFLGHDVADTALTSAVTNCGFRDDERDALAAAWAPRLNAGGLFDAPADAMAWRALSDVRIAAHAPFAMFALYTLGSIAPTPSRAAP